MFPQNWCVHVGCPFCQALAGEKCRTRATGREARRPHDVRILHWHERGKPRGPRGQGNEYEEGGA